MVWAGMPPIIPDPSRSVMNGLTGTGGSSSRSILGNVASSTLGASGSTARFAPDRRPRLFLHDAFSSNPGPPPPPLPASSPLTLVEPRETNTGSKFPSNSFSCCFLLCLFNAKMAMTVRMARAPTPPTTPPAIAPVLVLEEEGSTGREVAVSEGRKCVEVRVEV